jgi:hypothetical protein
VNVARVAETDFERVVESTVMRKWKLLFVNGCPICMFELVLRWVRFVNVLINYVGI